MGNTRSFNSSLACPIMQCLMTHVASPRLCAADYLVAVKFVSTLIVTALHWF